MYPEIFHIGNFPINTYGVLLALAFLAALLVSARLGARDGVPRGRLRELGVGVVLAGVAGWGAGVRGDGRAAFRAGSVVVARGDCRVEALVAGGGAGISRRAVAPVVAGFPAL